MLRALVSLFLFSTSFISRNAYCELTCERILSIESSLTSSAEAGAQNDREYESLLSMVENGQENYALGILESRLEMREITLSQVSLLARIYENQRSPMAEVQTLVYYIDQFQINYPGQHVRLIQALIRLFEQQPEHISTLETTGEALFIKLNNSYEFMSFGSKVFFRYNLYGLTKKYAQRMFELSETITSKIKSLQRLQAVSAELGEFEDQNTYLEQVSQLRPDHPATLFQLAKVNYHKLYRSQDALNHLSVLFNSNPSDYFKSRAYALEIRILLSMKENEKAFSRANQARLEFAEDTMINELYEAAHNRIFGD